jgi:2-oxoglutarate dehydrogenase E1 component
MTVAIPTTPANYFHLLRWQAMSGRRKPLIIFTPKSMLRLKNATSEVADFTGGSFLPLIGEPAGFDTAAVRRIVLCTGKVYYDLTEGRQVTGASQTAIVRVERLYPLPVDELEAELARYPGAEELVWAQEEPANMGAWPRMALKLPELLGRPVSRMSLPPSSAPAAGSAAMHNAEHRALIEAALGQGTDSDGSGHPAPGLSNGAGASARSSRGAALGIGS